MATKQATKPKAEKVLVFAWEGMDKRLPKKYDKYVQHTESLIIKDLLEHSFIPEDPRLKWDDVSFARWEIHIVSPGQVDDYLEQMTVFQGPSRLS